MWEKNVYVHTCTLYSAVTLLYSWKLTKHCKPTIMGKKIIKKFKIEKEYIDLRNKPYKKTVWR